MTLNTQAVSLTFNSPYYEVRGCINFSNVMTLYDNSLIQFQDNNQLDIDFSACEASDSSALALILAWINFAKQNKKTIRFHHLSKGMMAIIQASGIEELIV